MNQPTALFMGLSRMEFEVLDSTNSFALRLLDSRPPEGTLILARNQTGGRGQAGNTWYAESGNNLSFSLILYPTCITDDKIFILSQMVSVALRQTILHYLPAAEVHIKWPNDILLNGKKIAGILIENTWKHHRISASVMGIGLNLNTRTFPEEIREKATSFFLYTQKEVVPEDFLSHFNKNLEVLYLQLIAGNRDSIQRNYLSALWRYQEWAHFIWENHPQEGMIIGVNVDGKLAVQTKNNALRYFDLKEIVFT